MDAFDPDFAEQAGKGIKNDVKETADDPWCIGYFVHNELHWGWKTIGGGAITAGPDQPAKKAFVKMLKEKYPSIVKLNNSWNTDYSSWDALLESKEAPDMEKAEKDCREFAAAFAEVYFKTIRDAVKAAAPNKLYLGCRFNTYYPESCQAAAKYCDIVSFNAYKYPYPVKTFQVPGGGADVPLISSEWHFCATDRGLFDTGIRPASSQQHRAQRYKEYAKAALQHPQWVGIHWFRYKDQPATGRRLDGANAQNGLVDICDTPYWETVKAAREIGLKMYQYRAEGKW
jgi:hypothetical protein